MHIERFGKSGICFFKPLSILEVDASISLREIREITSILQPSAAIWVVFLFHFYDIPWPFPVWRVLMRALQVRRLKSLQEIHRSKNLAPDGCPDRTCWSLWSMPLRVFCCGLPILSILMAGTTAVTTATIPGLTTDRKILLPVHSRRGSSSLGWCCRVLEPAV